MPSNEDFKVQISGAVLANNIDTSIKSQLKSIKDLSIKVSNVEFDQSAIADIKNSLEKNKINLKLDLNTSGINKQAMIAGKNVGSLISKSAQNAINSVGSTLGKSIRIDPSTSNEFKRQMTQLVSEWTNAKGKLTDIKIDTRTSYDSDAQRNIETLKQATVTYKNELDEVIKKTIAWKQIGVGQDDSPIYGYVEAAGQYSKAIDEAGKRTDNFINKQKQAVATLKNTLNQVSSKALDVNAPKAINTDSNRDLVVAQTEKVKASLATLEQANTSTFTDAKIAVEGEISALQVLVTELQRAESTATAFRDKPIEVIRDETLQKVSGLASDMQKVGVESDSLKSKLSEMNSTLAKDDLAASDIKGVLNTYAVAKSELVALKKNQDAYNASLNAMSKASGLSSTIDVFEQANPGVKEFKVTVGDAEVSLESLRAALQSISTTQDVNVVTQQFKAFEAAAKSAGVATKETVSDFERLKATAQGIQYKVDTGSQGVEVKSIVSDFQKFGAQEKELSAQAGILKTKYNELTLASAEFAKGGDPQKLIDAQKSYQKELDISKNRIKELSIEGSKVDPLKNLSLSNKMETWIQKNSAATKMFGAQVEELRRQLEGADAVTFNRINGQFNSMIVQARNAGKLGKSFTESIKSAAASFTQWVSVTSIIMTGIRTLGQMKDAVYDIDTAMTNLYKVTDETSAKYQSFLKGSATEAKALGASISDLVTQTADWAKLGYSLDDAAKLSKNSMIYANVGEVDNATAVSDLVTALKAFNSSASESIKYIDMYNQIGNSFAVSAKGIGEGVKNSASALALQGNTIEQTVAMLAGGGEITQDVGELGNMLKIVSLRLASMKGALKEINAEYEDIESVSKNQTEIYNMTKGQVNILDEQNGKLKTTYEILEGVAGAWDSVNSNDKSSLLELMFGKLRANQGAAILNAFQSGQVQKALESAKNSAGSAMAEQETYMQSLQAKIGTFQASYQSLSQTLIGSDLLKGLVDSGTSLITILDTILQKFGSFNTILTVAAGGLSLFKNVGRTKSFVLTKYADSNDVPYAKYEFRRYAL